MVAAGLPRGGGPSERPLALISRRELKHRSMKLPNEPKFKLHDYVKKEVRGTGCCKS